MMECDCKLLGLCHIQQMHSLDEVAFALGLILLCLGNVTIICGSLFEHIMLYKQCVTMTSQGAPTLPHKLPVRVQLKGSEAECVHKLRLHSSVCKERLPERFPD